MEIEDDKEVDESGEEMPNMTVLTTAECCWSFFLDVLWRRSADILTLEVLFANVSNQARFAALTSGGSRRLLRFEVLFAKALRIHPFCVHFLFGFFLAALFRSIVEQTAGGFRF